MSQIILSGFVNANYMMLPYHYKEALNLNDNNYKKLLEFWDMLIKNKRIEKLVEFISTLSNISNNDILKKDFNSNIKNYKKSKSINNNNRKIKSKKLYSEYDNKVNIYKHKSAKKTNKMFSNRISKF